MQIFADKIFTNPIKVIQAFDEKSFKEALFELDELKKRRKYYILGYIRYEAKDVFLNKKIKSKYPLLYFEVFEDFEKFCDFEEKTSDFSLKISPLISYDRYVEAIEKIKEEISCGNTYEVNYTYDWKIETDLSGFDLYKAILPRQKTPYNAYIKNEFEEILSFSPELFFELEENKIKTKPMKGTVKRGETKEEDDKNILFLKNDVKNRAENVMIVDLLRNDLGKIAKTGTVKVDKLFEIETHQTLHQMTSEITAELEEDKSLYDIFEAIFPCGSITGAPKINTMKIIEEVEAGSREVYCGAIGLITPEKTVFSVPIRILQKHNGEKDFLYRVGGAIVWDSTVKEEWEETFTKIKFLQPDFKLVETMLVENGEIRHEKEHFRRMENSAKELGFKFSKQKIQVDKSKNKYILRVLLSKDGVFETQELALKEITTKVVTVSKTPVNSIEPLLYHKTTHRPWYENSTKKIKNGEIFDEIFFNEKGELTEGARSNIILEIGGKWFTPPVKCGLLNGVLRQEMLNQNKIEKKTLYLEDLKRAEKIFCINSVRGIVEVSPPALEGEVWFQFEQTIAKTRKQGGGIL